MPLKILPQKSLFPGILTGGTALFLPLFMLRENRITDGTSYGLNMIAGSFGMTIAAGMLLAPLAAGILFSGQEPAERIRGRTALLSGTLLLSFLLILIIRAETIMPRLNPDYTRISAAAGWWLLAAGACFHIHQGLRESELSRWTALLPLLIPAVLLIISARAGMLSRLGIVLEYSNEKNRFYSEILNHLSLAFSAVFRAVLAGIPLGLLAHRRRKWGDFVFSVVNGIQTMPSLALFGLLIAPLALLSQKYPVLRDLGVRGVGRTPALIALSLYGLLPVVRNTYISMEAVDNDAVLAGKGMGMNSFQLFFKVKLPLAFPVLLGGIKIASVQTMGNTTVAALIGAGGLGFFIFRGLEQTAPDLILLGALPIIAMVLIFERLFSMLITILTPGGIRHD